MRRALFDNWALFLGVMMLMVANGLLVTLLSIRGARLGFSDLEISIMQACYPVGALVGTMMTPRMIARVGHIRVFSALASAVSTASIMHLLTSDPVSWSLMRFLAGFCFPGLYVITESWLNAKVQNKIRAQVLSVYFVIQTAGPALGTAMVGLPDPGGNLLFGLTSILLSLAIVPLLLSGIRAPDYEVPERMPVTRLAKISPTVVFGILATGAGVSAWFISLPLYALQRGFSDSQASFLLVFAMLAAAAVQYPVGWISDNTDRRNVVFGLSIVAALAAVWMTLDTSAGHIALGFAVISATTLPVYSILAAHANDQLSPGQIVPASGTMVFLLQLGQVFGILIGPNLLKLADGRGLQIFLVVISASVAILALARRATTSAPEETGMAQPMSVLGAAQPGRLQAEQWSLETDASDAPPAEESSTK
ncbi:MAG: MFS transporter [Pseudomonadota bacterium]